MLVCADAPLRAAAGCMLVVARVLARVRTGVNLPVLDRVGPLREVRILAASWHSQKGGEARIRGASYWAQTS